MNTTFFVVEIFAGRFAAISNILLSGRNPVLWTSMPPGMNYWKTVRLSSPPNRGGGLIAPRFDWVNLFCLLLALWVTDPPICSFLTAFRRKHFILRGYAPQAARGVVCANAPFSTVRNIKSASSLAHSASTCAFDLLTGLSIRTVHWTVLISDPLRPGGFPRSPQL